MGSPSISRGFLELPHSTSAVVRLTANFPTVNAAFFLEGRLTPLWLEATVVVVFTASEMLATESAIPVAGLAATSATVLTPVHLKSGNRVR